jgi:uncharacterized protein (DUF2384 family)
LWLQRANALLGGFAPIQILLNDPAKYEIVEDELTRIDYAVLV